MTNSVNNGVTTNGDIIVQDDDDDEFVIPENVEDFFAQPPPEHNGVSRGHSIVDRHDYSSIRHRDRNPKNYDPKNDLLDGKLYTERVNKDESDEVFSKSSPDNDRISEFSHVEKVEYVNPNKNKTDVTKKGFPQPIMVAEAKQESPVTNHNLHNRASPSLYSNDNELRESPISNTNELREAPISNDKELSSPRESPQDHGPDTRDFIHVNMDLNKCETPFQRQDTIIKDQLFEMFGMDSHGNLLMRDICKDIPVEDSERDSQQVQEDSMVHQTHDLPVLSSQNVDGEFLI